MVTGVLRKKLLRDLRTLRGQGLAIAAIVACGVASLLCIATAYHGLEQSRDDYYTAYRMPDLFAAVKKAPAAVVNKERAKGAELSALVEKLEVQLAELSREMRS